VTRDVVVNALAFQACWVAFVAGGARGWWWLGFALLLPFAAWQLARSQWPRADVALVALSAALGFACDSMFAWTGMLDYATPVPWRGVAPVWIVGLWIAFALTLNHSLAFLKRRPLVAAALGAAAGPFAYWVADRAWQAVAVGAPALRTYLALAVAWGVMTPLLLALATRLALREVSLRSVGAAR
jgi:hypothetical protein